MGRSRQSRERETRVLLKHRMRMQQAMRTKGRANEARD